jgi:hypothetical protein
MVEEQSSESSGFLKKFEGGVTWQTSHRKPFRLPLRGADREIGGKNGREFREGAFFEHKLTW